MRKISLGMAGQQITTKELNDGFVAFVEKHLKEANIELGQDNSAKVFLVAYLKLAEKYYKDEKEIEKLLQELETLPL